MLLLNLYLLLKAPVATLSLKTLNSYWDMTYLSRPKLTLDTYNHLSFVLTHTLSQGNLYSFQHNPFDSINFQHTHPIPINSVISLFHKFSTYTLFVPKFTHITVNMIYTNLPLRKSTFFSHLPLNLLLPKLIVDTTACSNSSTLSNF